MKNAYLLQNEFINWLDSQLEPLSFKQVFYDYQIKKLNEILGVYTLESSFLEVLEIEVMCNNNQGVEDLVQIALEKIEKNSLQKDLGMSIKPLEALQIGLLKYRLFLHDFIASRNKNIKKAQNSSNFFSETKQVSLESIFKGNTGYFIPIYHDVFIYDKLEVDSLWQLFLKSNTEKGVTAVPTTVNYGLGNILVKKREDNQLEVVDGGQTLILLFILKHVLNAFLVGTNDPVTEETENRNLSSLITFGSCLNDQKLFPVLINNGIDKKATSANEISKGIFYSCEEPGLNKGYAFLQATFRFVQLVQESQIAQSEVYIVDMDVFVRNVLKNNGVKIKCLSDENSEKTYLNHTNILIENIREWL